MKKCDIFFLYLIFFVLTTIKRCQPFIIPNNTKMVNGPLLKSCCRSKRVVTIFGKKKKNRKVVVIECTEARKYGKQPSRYVTEKNKVNTPKKLQLYKYNKYLKRRTLHVEIK
ncbi:50S ribosomal protein L33, putative [Plasmodium vivax]|uniref:50S ribosomal protein L33, putative n=6 Tax=Plasmodium vivax TaxID=5855 RepID=A5JZS8_PLAVS|nr:50S ribosomal protein L33, putative [Plasmodium vivax]KMZ78038.1 50S ribosomal protein L33 [Plasmodium vivax India VII]KMZ84378.1 50S ribosomal protein L33 [Plasmodium vivax Brazil I]KMZ90158.1 50S ribosomal protein L33 [Plasmodium vivax Mauritania I]KMZ96867.1 50S ribosomal protein L33 [Plasmodium vivax North Korean]EDL47489.1 50S ribosomal protein L33, putative [Plasmodium vivax]|eukprot:XP_001617216.1 50S ribosomal protein L33 [Plasmodium vivax Sal-1]